MQKTPPGQLFRSGCVVWVASSWPFASSLELSVLLPRAFLFFHIRTVTVPFSSIFFSHSHTLSQVSTRLDYFAISRGGTNYRKSVEFLCRS
ncbi:hypothetical protein MRB53_030248 [Persea americana]|uniref:Uncharacterized protein n=1 Tax=Persea americana TaxID=3435 RepID=A0ACC2KL73_PERAE|nr:hypothetical protein MRB53_030248 [Persea americana]